MAGNLNPSIFLDIQDIFKKRCITLFIDAYDNSISDESISLDFDENDITAILHSYIDKNPKREKWEISTNVENHLFDKSVPFKKGFSAKLSRIDMRFTQFWQAKEYRYYIEAKNLKANNSNLKRRYISTGINNFLQGGKYQNCDGFLVGYVLEGTINQCIEGINKLLKKDKREKEMLNEEYISIHNEKQLFHLFFDYTDLTLKRLNLIKLL